jgi:Predicted integral membrane protein (DUF2269)
VRARDTVPTVKEFLLSLHVVAAIVLVGPMTLAVSVFPRYARTALDPAAVPEADRAAALAGLLHRMSRGYAVLSLSVPVIGVALAGRMHVLGDLWVVVSLVLTIKAAALLATVVLPQQHRLLVAVNRSRTSAALHAAAPPGRLYAVAPGLFALLWVAVVVLMVLRPGSTTGI